MTSFVGEPGKAAETRILAGMLLQRSRLLEVVVNLRDGGLSPSEAGSYLALVRDNLAAIRKTVHLPDGAPIPGERLVAPLEHVRNRLFDLLAGLRRGELTDQHAADYLVMVGSTLATVRKAALSLR